MELKKVVPASLMIVLGLIVIYLGYLQSIPTLYTIGIGGVFLGLLAMTFTVQSYVRSEYSDALLDSHMELIEKILEHLDIDTKGIYIPPKPDLEEGGVFLPVHEDFDLDLSILNDDKVFITGKTGKDLGLLFTPPGKHLINVYEDYLEYELTNLADVEELETLGNPLRGLELADGVTVYEEGEELVIRVKGLKDQNLDHLGYNQVGGPVFSSLILGLAKGTRKVWGVKRFEVNSEEDYVEASLEDLGRPEEWR